MSDGTVARSIMILGASGRAGRMIARALSMRDHQVVLVGRKAAPLDSLAASLISTPKFVVAQNLDEMIAAIRSERPTVVINTIGPFGKTALPIIDGCPPGTHYVDLANEMQVFEAMIEAESRIKGRQQCVVTGAGWGVLATESVVMKLCAGQPNAKSVRVDNLASVTADGTLGNTVAATIVDSLSYGGRCYQDGRLKRVRMGYRPDRFPVPDGTIAITGGASTADLEAARRASGAAEIVAGAELAPTSVIMAIVVSIMGLLCKFGPVRRLLQTSLSKMPNPPPKRAVSWARAVVEWPDGSRRVGWLRAGDSYAFLALAAAETAVRLADGQGKPGVHTPGALFGSELAELAGATFILDDAVAA